MEEKPKTQNRIGLFSAIILLVFAGIFDLLTLIPFVGTVAGPIYWAVASLYFLKIGMGFVNPKRVVTLAVSTVIELIPVVQWIPSIFIGILIIIIITRIEDKTGLSISNPMKNVVMPPRAMRIPKNIGGIRKPNI